MKHVAIYARVSGKQQDTRSQKPDLERWAAAQDVPVKWYSDRFTGKTMDRPGWNRLQAAIDAGEVSAVIVWRIDRLGAYSTRLDGSIRLPAREACQPYQSQGCLDLSTAAVASMAQRARLCRSIPRLRYGQSASWPGRLLPVPPGKIWGGGKPVAVSR